MVYCDSQSATDLTKNATYHNRTKYINVRYHLLRKMMGKKLMKVKKVHTNENPKDMLTKVVTR